MSKKSQFTYERSDLSPAYLAETREYFEQLEYLPTVSYSNACRYKNLRTLKDEETGKIHHESWSQQVIEETTEDTYVTVTNETENRLDMIAYTYYGSARYWWVVALANYIKDPFDVKVGMTLRIPPLLSLYKSGGVLNG